MFAAATTPPRLLTLVLVTALSVLSLNMFLPSLANMADDFGVSYALANLSIAGYLAITAVLQMIMGPLSDRYGRRPILLVGLAIFVLASIGCVLATDFWVFLFFRLLQGAIVGGMALSRAVVRDMVPPQEAASVMGYISMAMAIAPMLGPMAGGALDEFFGWRSNFLIFAVLGTAMLAICWADLGETNENPSETFSKQFRTYPELFTSRRFWGHSVCLAFSIGTFYTFLSGAPLVAKTALSLSPAELGIYMGIITVGFFCGSFFSGRFGARYKLTSMMISGRIVACIGLSTGLVLVLLGYVSPPIVFGASIFVGLGNGLTLPSSNVGVMSVRPRLAGSASGLSGALTVAIGAVLSSVTGVVLTAENGAWGLIALMLLTSIVGLLGALYVLWIDTKEGPPEGVREA